MLDGSSKITSDVAQSRAIQYDIIFAPNDMCDPKSIPNLYGYAIKTVIFGGMSFVS